MIAAFARTGLDNVSGASGSEDSGELSDGEGRAQHERERELEAGINPDVWQQQLQAIQTQQKTAPATLSDPLSTVSNKGSNGSASFTMQ